MSLSLLGSRMENQDTKPQRGKRSDADDDKIKVSISSDEDESDIECDLCDKLFTCVKAYEQHLNSKKHYKMLQAKKLMKKLGKSDASHVEANEDSANESPEEITCEICSKSFSGYIPYAAHLKSHSHNKNVKTENMKEAMKDMPEVISKDENVSDEDDVLPKPFAECSHCQKVFYSPRALKQHMDGVNHKKKMQGIKVLESLRKDVPENLETKVDDEKIYGICEVCNKSFSGPKPYKIHLHSSAHQKQLKRIEKEEELKDFFTKDPETHQLICKECSTAFNDPFALKVHLNSNSHEKKKAKDEILNSVSSYPEVVAVKTVQNLSSDEESDENKNYQNGSYFLVCKLCHMSFSGPKSVQDHIKSKKHLQVKREKELRKRLQIKSQTKSKEVKQNDLNGSDQARGSDNKTLTPSYTSSDNSKSKISPSKPIMDGDFEVL